MRETAHYGLDDSVGSGNEEQRLLTCGGVIYAPSRLMRMYLIGDASDTVPVV